MDVLSIYLDQDYKNLIVAHEINPETENKNQNIF